MIASLIAVFLVQDPARLVEQVSEKRMEADLEKLVSFKTRNCFSDAESPDRGIGAARAWLKSEFEKIAKDAKSGMLVDYHDFEGRDRFTGKTAPQKNVLAIIRGKKHPKSAVVFGAHYDTINMKDKDPNAGAPGANDNGSGTVAVLEAARILSKHEFDRSIILVAFAGEEHGLQGSRAFAKFLKESAFDVLAMVNNDIVGGVQDAKEGKNENTIRCFSDPKHASSRQFARLAKWVGERHVKGFEILLQETADRPGRGGDHQSFNREGMTALRLIETHENLEHQHTDSDLIEFISFAYLRKAAQVDLALVASLANGPATPGGLKVSRSGANLQVSWDAVDGASGYFVGVRGDGIAFERVVESRKTSLDLPAGEGAVFVSVASRGRNGGLSLFSAEITPEEQR